MSKKNKKAEESVEEKEQSGQQAGEEKNFANDECKSPEADGKVNEESTPEEPKEPTPEERIAQLEAKTAQLIDQNLRQMADFDNYRKRTLKEKAEIIKNAAADVLTKILPVIDDLERAIEYNGKSDDIDAIKEGTQLIYNKLMHILDGEGLKKIPAKGEKFDSDIHEAIATVPAADEDSKGKVIDCTRDGYKLNDKLLRAAHVVVAN